MNPPVHVDVHALGELLATHEAALQEGARGGGRRRRRRRGGRDLGVMESGLADDLGLPGAVLVGL